VVDSNSTPDLAFDVHVDGYYDFKKIRVVLHTFGITICDACCCLRFFLPLLDFELRSFLYGVIDCSSFLLSVLLLLGLLRVRVMDWMYSLAINIHCPLISHF
jgi:hypothetical protein